MVNCEHKFKNGNFCTNCGSSVQDLGEGKSGADEKIDEKNLEEWYQQGRKLKVDKREELPVKPGRNLMARLALVGALGISSVLGLVGYGCYSCLHRSYELEKRIVSSEEGKRVSQGIAEREVVKQEPAQTEKITMPTKPIQNDGVFIPRYEQDLCFTPNSKTSEAAIKIDEETYLFKIFDDPLYKYCFYTIAFYPKEEKGYLRGFVYEIAKPSESLEDIINSVKSISKNTLFYSNVDKNFVVGTEKEAKRDFYAVKIITKSKEIFPYEYSRDETNNTYYALQRLDLKITAGIYEQKSVSSSEASITKKQDEKITEGQKTETRINSGLESKLSSYKTRRNNIQENWGALQPWSGDSPLEAFFRPKTETENLESELVEENQRDPAYGDLLKEVKNDRIQILKSIDRAYDKRFHKLIDKRQYNEGIEVKKQEIKFLEENGFVKWVLYEGYIYDRRSQICNEIASYYASPLKDYDEVINWARKAIAYEDNPEIKKGFQERLDNVIKTQEATRK